MVRALKELHGLGYLHLDLKPANIVMSCSNSNDPASSRLHLIDFGVSQRYLTQNGDHIPETRVSSFKGNLMFASFTAFSLLTLSRRDDLVSMMYILIYLIRSELPWSFYARGHEAKSRHNLGQIKNLKLFSEPVDLCIGRA